MELDKWTFHDRKKGNKKVVNTFYTLFVSSNKMDFRILICGPNTGPARILTLASTFRFSALNVTINGQDPN